jgi:hypothetical protein
MRNVAVLPPLKSKVRIALMRIAAYEEISTPQLIEAARALPGGTKVHIPDYLTAIVLLFGNPAFRSELG